VTAQAGSLRFYVDESALGLGKTLAAARTDTVHAGHRVVPERPLGTPDEDWIPAVAVRDLVAIGRDKRVRTRPAELALIRATGLRVLRIGGKRDMPTWDWLVRLVRRWDDIEALVRSRPNGPGST
jgi:hypothetical protein